MIPSIIIFVVWIIIGIVGGLFFEKMLNILVENKKGSYLYCRWRLWLSLSFFKEFIEEGDFDLKQKEEYISLYKRGLYAKRIGFISLFLLIVLLLVLSNYVNFECPPGGIRI